MMFYINSDSFSARKLLLFLINLNFYLLFDPVKAATIPNYHGNNDNIERVCQNYCTTQACQDYENQLLVYMNTSVDPCDDFYEFACGNFNRYFSSFVDMDTLKDMTEASVVEILDEFNEGIKEKDSSAIRKLKIYYQNCMDKARIEEEGEEMLLNILNKIGGWPVLLGDNWNENDFDIMTTINKIIQENLTLFFPITLGVKETNYKKKILTIDGPSTVINQFFSSETLGEQRYDAYLKLMVDTAVALGANESVVEEELLDVILFEKTLYDSKISEGGNNDAFFNVSVINELPRTKFNISWSEMIMKAINTNIDFSQTNEIYFKHLSYFRKFEELFNGTSKRVVANYIAWQFIYNSLKYQPTNLEQLHVVFIKNVTGIEYLPIYKCYNEMSANFQHALSALYVRMHYNPVVNDDVTNLFQNIKEQFKLNLKKIDWMDENTRLLASEKVDAMTMEPPYPNKLAGDEVDEYFRDFEVNPGSYFESFLNISAFKNKKKFEGLYQKYNKSSWIAVYDSVTANAYYQYFFNQMTLPAGFMRAPIYHPERPQYLNYGGAGSIIGHEITHGFDSTGSQFNKNGYLENWWQQDTQNNYLEKVQCMIEQYNNFTLALTGQSVDGSRTQNENIADNGGFKMAYYAYQMWSKRQNISEACLSSFNYNPQQLFWISAAKNWCFAQSPEIAYNKMLTDSHSPAPARVINSFSNIKEFAEDFQCKLGSRMNPEKRCIVW